MIPMIVATGIALLVLWPDPVARPDAPDSVPRHNGQVTAVRIETCPAGKPDERTPSGLAITRCGSVDVRVEDGPDAGRIVTTPVPAGPGAPTVDIGDNVVMLVFVRSAVGTLGLIAAVPITTALAAVVTAGRQQPDPTQPMATQTRPRPRPPADADGAALAADRHTIATPWADQT